MQVAKNTIGGSSTSMEQEQKVDEKRLHSFFDFQHHYRFLLFLAVPGLSCSMQDLFSYSMWDLVP